MRLRRRNVRDWLRKKRELEMSKIILGIDPGKTGALSFLDVELGVIFVSDMPVVSIGKSDKRTEVCSVRVGDLIDQFDVHTAFIEDVWSLPHDGHVGAFSFGDAYGTVKGVLGGLNIPMSRVLPSLWKKNLKVPAEKDESRARACQLIPAGELVFSRAKDDGRAESAMIALFGCFSLGWFPSKALEVQLIPDVH